MKVEIIENSGEPEALEMLVRHTLLGASPDSEIHAGIPLISCALGEILDKLFPFYLPIWELDHC